MSDPQTDPTLPQTETASPPSQSIPDWNTAQWPRAVASALVMIAAILWLLPLLPLADLTADTSPLPDLTDMSSLGSSRWSVAAGTVKSFSGGFTLVADQNATAAVEIFELELPADRCPEILIKVSGENAFAPTHFELCWTRRNDPVPRSRTFIANKNDSADRHQHDEAIPDTFSTTFREELLFDPAWKGTITSLRLTTRSTPENTLVIESVTVPIEQGSGLLHMLWRQWWHFESIDERSINSIQAPHILGMRPAFIVGWLAAAVTLSIVAFAAWRRRTIRITTLLLPVLLLWLVNDARWLTGQYRQYAADVVRYPQDESPVMLEHAFWGDRISQMANFARSQIYTGTTYGVIGGDLTAGDSRLRYLLSPEWIQVNLDPLQPNVPLSEATHFIGFNTYDAPRVGDDVARFAIPGDPNASATLINEIRYGPFLLRRVQE